MEFRKDINGLRAIAVLAVVLFHFEVSGFTGGFSGVDLFFVISGYLMTSIIIGGLRKESFSLLDFYSSRFRRIVPALVALCLALFVLGFVYLPTDDYRDLLRSIKNSLYFASNHSYAANGNYFDAPTKENWLLHTWSLSVEWQFYLLYPVIILAGARLLGMERVRWLVLLLAVISLVGSILYTPLNPVSAFYLLPARAWEMLAGGLVFLFPVRGGRLLGQVLAGVGMALLLWSILALDSSYLWPSYFALLPVLGTVLVLQGNIQSPLLGNPGFQFLGNVSYSVYLWHWPVAVFMHVCGLIDKPMLVAVAIALSLLLGTLSYYGIEQRFRYKHDSRKQVLRYCGVIAMGIVLAASLGSMLKKHPDIRWAFQEPEKPNYQSSLYTRSCQARAPGELDCQLDEGRISAIILGDSHGESTAAAVQLDNDSAALQWVLGGCPFLLDFSMRDKEKEQSCKAFLSSRINDLKSKHLNVPVILLNRGGIYTDSDRGNNLYVYFEGNNGDTGTYETRYKQAYVKAVCEISAAHPVYLVKPIPEMPFNIYKGLALQSKFMSATFDITLPYSAYESRSRLAIDAMNEASRKCGAKLLDPAPYLCPEGRCLGSLDGKPLYFDDNHLVDYGNEQLRGLFKEVFQPVL